MTAIVGFTWGMAAVLLTDSRLSYVGPNGKIVTVRDVCQKLWVPNGWSAVGFAGDLCLGNELARSFFVKLHDMAWTRTNLLTDDDAMRELAFEAVANHPAQYGEKHETCTAKYAGLLFAYVVLVRSNKSDGTIDHYELGTALVSIDATGTIERSGLGAEVLGDGAEQIRSQLTLELTVKIANAGTAELQTLVALNATSSLIQEYKVREAGGPFQVVHVSAKGVLLVPYWYWAKVTKRFGTYVAMRIEDGDWVQDHRPSGSKIRIKRPTEILNQELDEGPWPLGKAEMFDPHSALSNTSRGVIRAPNPNLIYAVYEPEKQVPAQVVASWGEALPPLLTWNSPGAAAEAAGLEDMADN